jgi:PhzF family phenazine biosynthesis protein
MKQYIVDAFTNELFCGNPAAVLPCRTMPDVHLMQKIAIENNYSETAFVVQRHHGFYDLKWFTPGGEIDLCGHATLATAYVLHHFVDTNVMRYSFNTLSGKLVVAVSGDEYTMDFPIGKSKPIPLTDELMSATKGLALEAFYDGGDLVCVIGDENELASFVPDAEAVRRLPGLGLILTAPSREYDFVSRCFYPKISILEDPVTGRAHTFLAPIWSKKLRKNTLLAKQVSKRGGIIRLHLSEDRVFLSGQCTLFMQGEIPFEL